MNKCKYYALGRGCVLGLECIHMFQPEKCAKYREIEAKRRRLPFLSEIRRHELEIQKMEEKKKEGRGLEKYFFT